MPETVFEIECSNPELVKKSLEVDAKAERGSKVTITAKKSSVQIKISSDKPNKLKSIENSYRKLVGLLNKISNL